MDASTNLFIGIDVGSYSVRCAVVNENGHIISTNVQPITVWNPKSEYYQQSSDDIWDATVKATKNAMIDVNPDHVNGIGFDATCSLVVLDNGFKPLSVSPDGEPDQNIIVWMDHRATIEANLVNSLKLPCLKFVGGVISPEMQPPKIMWIKKYLSQIWSKVGHLMDLPDFLTWKASGSKTRSLCSLVCKWLYQADSDNQFWDPRVWKALGLEELNDNKFAIIGQDVLMPGQPCGFLNAMAAKQMGLKTGIPVATSMIDAHAGGIGTIGCSADGVSAKFTSRLALISGTSACHMKLSEQAIFVPGVWGPYYSVMVPGLYMNEAGQSAAGSLIDHIINTHPANAELQNSPDLHIQEKLNAILDQLALKSKISLSNLTSDLHIWPDFHGNRSPLADPGLKGMIMGLTLSSGTDDLAKLYLATIQALAYGTKHIITSMETNGHVIESLIICGGLSKNRLFVQTHADVLGIPVVLPREPEPVLLGSAMLAATASGRFENLKEAMVQMGGKGRVVKPNVDDKNYHDRKFKVFLSMVEFQRQAQIDMLN